MKKNLIRLASLGLFLVLFFSMMASPAEARASDYISRCSASVTAAGSGKIKVTFTVNGTGIMTSIGATKVEIKNSAGTTIQTYNYTNSGYSSMMGSNRSTYTSSVTYSGVFGATYYAIVYFKAANSSGSDTDTVTTYLVTAT
jgi:hypothetical protein